MNKKTSPTISVIMPVYNGEKYLREAIDSILNQTYTNFEFIILNDGSTDRSLKIIDEYAKKDTRIFVISRENRGLIVSLNEGIQYAKGKYIARMDADDISLEKRFEKQLELIEEKNVDICGCHYFAIDEQNKYIDTKIVPISSDAININIAYSVPFAHGSVMMKKSLFEVYKYGMDNFNLAEDYGLWLNMYAGNVKFGNVDDFLFKYRDFSNSFSKTKIQKMENERVLLSKKFILKYQNVLKKSIDNQLNVELSNWEEIYLVRISLLLFYKVSEVRNKINKQNFIFAFLSYIKQKLFKQI